MKTNRPLAVILFLLATTMACPFARSQSADSCKVWFTPNIGSTDMLQLFSNPAKWDSARSKVEVFQFFAHQLNTWPCMGGICDSNTISNLVQVQAFTKLNQWGIDIAIEGAGILPLTPFGTPVNCTLEKQNAVQDAFNWTVDAINNVQSNGGVVRYIAIDEPIRRWYSKIYPPLGGPECKTDSLAEIAAMVADFINMMQNSYPSIIVGQIILYPEVDVDDIKTYVIEMENLGISLPFIHLDVHGGRITDYVGPSGMVSLSQVKTDLQDLESFLHAHNITFAPILTDLKWNTQGWLFGQYDDKTYYDGAIDWIDQVKSAIGQPDVSIFQSWVSPYYLDTNLSSYSIPVNLPENDTSIYSHTRLIINGCNIILTGLSRPPTGLSEKLLLYPNPFSDFTTLKFDNPNNESRTLLVFDITGKLVYEQKNITSNQIQLKKGNLKKGMYFVQLKTNNQLIGTKKLIIE